MISFYYLFWIEVHSLFQKSEKTPAKFLILKLIYLSIFHLKKDKQSENFNQKLKRDFYTFVNYQ